MTNSKSFQIKDKWIARQSGIIILLAIAFFAMIPMASASCVTGSGGTPLQGALVKLDLYPQYFNYTNVLGCYILKDVPEGTYSISARANGNFINTSTVVVPAIPGVEVTKDFILTPGYTTYVPWIAYSQSGWYIPIVVQNVGIATAHVNVSMYDTNGNLVTVQPQLIAPKTSQVFWPPVGPTDGGSAVITSDVSVIALVNEIPKTGGDGMSYGGFSQGSKKVYIPWIAYAQSGWYIPIVVQNVDGLPAHVNVSMYDMNGNLVAVQQQTVASTTSTVFWPPVGPTDGGSAVITSDQNVIAIANEVAKVGSQSMSYEGFSAGSTKAYVPIINFSQTNILTPIVVQNIGTSSAQVNVSIYDSNGVRVDIQPRTILPNTSQVFWPPSASTPSGSAVVDSNQDIIVIVNELINSGTWAMSYDGFSAGSTLVNIPWIAYGNSGWYTPVFVQNTDLSSNAVTVSFYDQNGVLVEAQTATIPANTSRIFVPAPSASTTGGSAVVSSLTQPLVAAVNEIDAASRQGMAYIGVLG